MNKNKEPSFITKISPRKDKATRTLTALTYGSLTGEIIGGIAGSIPASIISWMIPAFDWIHKKSCSKKDLSDYVKFKSAAILTGIDYQKAFDFFQEKYLLVESYVDNLTNYF